MRDREKPLQEATSANAQKLLELEQLGLLQTYKNYELLTITKMVTRPEHKWI